MSGKAGRIKRTCAATLVALAVPAVAFAAKPVGNGHYAQVKGNMQLFGLDVLPNGKSVTNVQLGKQKCTPVPFNPPITMKVKPSGTFALTGSRKDVLGKKWNVVISGKFVKSTEAKGKYKVSGKGCAGKTYQFDAKLTGQNS